jgi:hypothetical protein
LSCSFAIVVPFLNNPTLLRKTGEMAPSFRMGTDECDEWRSMSGRRLRRFPIIRHFASETAAANATNRADKEKAAGLNRRLDLVEFKRA